MDFLAKNKLSQAVLYWKDKTRLDAIVERQVKGVQRKIRCFLNDVRALLGPGAAVEGVSVSAEQAAAAAFDSWEAGAFRSYDSKAGTSHNSDSLVSVRRRMLGRRLARLRAVFVETCAAAARMLDTPPPLHATLPVHPPHGLSPSEPGSGTGSGALSALGEALLCGICEDFFCCAGERAPRVLPCGHTLCSGCLAAVLPRHGACPMCRADLPATSTVEDFPKNYFIIQLLALRPPSALSSRKGSEGDLIELCTDV